MDVKIIAQRFMEDSIRDGDVHYHDTRENVYRGLDVREAADLITRHGLTFAATGGSWAADPDGSRIIDYRTAEREEVSAHLYRATVTEANEVARLVG